MTDGALSTAWSCLKHPALLSPFSWFHGFVPWGPLRSMWMLRGCSRSSSFPRAVWWHLRLWWGKYELGPRSAGTCYGCHKPWWHIFSARGPLEEYMVDLLRAVNMEMLETALEVCSLGAYETLIVKWKENPRTTVIFNTAIMKGINISSKGELLSWNTFSFAVKVSHMLEKWLKSCHEYLVNSFVLCCLVNLYKRVYLLSNSSIVILLPLSMCGSRSKAKVTQMSGSEKQHFIQLHDVIISAQKTELKNNTGIKCRWRKDSKHQGA